MVDSRNIPSKTGTRYIWFFRLLAGAIGLLLLTASFLKAMDISLFIGQIRAYGIIFDPIFIIITAWGLITVQWVLGAGLVLYYRPGWVLPLTTLLWLFLVGVTGWAWLTGVTQECGCYGAWVRQTPGIATLENIGFFLVTLLIWKYTGTSRTTGGKAKTAIMAAAIAIGLILPLFSGVPSVSKSQDQADDFPFELINDIHIPGKGRIDFRQGSHILFLMSTDCLHCQEALPGVDILADARQLPGVIALSMNGDMERKRFIKEYAPAYPIGQIKEDLFWRLLGMADLPRVFLLRDGRVLKVWNQGVPKVEEVAKVLGTAPS